MKKSKSKNLMKWFLGLFLWVLGFILMNIHPSYSSSCSSEILLLKGLQLARNLSGVEDLQTYQLDGDEIRFQFTNGKKIRMLTQKNQCEFNRIEMAD